MEVKALELDLGQINAMVMADSPNPVVATGWYVDPDTGQYYYYDAPTSQWYVYSAGLLYPLGLPSWQNSPSPKVELTYGDTLKINLSFTYVGPEQKGVFSIYAAIVPSKTSAIINEWEGFHTDYIPFDAPYSLVGTKVSKTINFKMPEASWLDTMGFLGHGGEDGAIYFKVHKDFLNEWFSPGYLNAIHIIKPTGEFGELVITTIEKV